MKPYCAGISSVQIEIYYIYQSTTHVKNDIE